MKQLKVFDCEITEYFRPGSLSYHVHQAAITASGIAAAKKIASENVKLYRSCKILRTVDAAPDAESGIVWR